MKKLLFLSILILSSCGDEVVKEKEMYKCTSWFFLYKETSVHKELKSANFACRIRTNIY